MLVVKRSRCRADRGTAKDLPAGKALSRRNQQRLPGEDHGVAQVVRIDDPGHDRPGIPFIAGEVTSDLPYRFPRTNDVAIQTVPSIGCTCLGTGSGPPRGNAGAHPRRQHGYQ